jgi:SAM-dependent methyltransferase
MPGAVAKEAKPAAGKPDYGLDAPALVKSMFWRAAWSLAFGLALFFMNYSEYPRPALNLLLALGGLAAAFAAVGAVMIWSSRVAKFQVRDRLLDALALTGDERVLDVGCGRGLMLIGAAKRLKKGRATGVDIWNPEDQSGNTADAVKGNARIEGVADKVRVDTCDARKLVYPDQHYDAVTSCLAIHNIPDREGRDQAIGEMWRVLKPGGRLAIFDLFKTGEYAKRLRELGAQDVELSPTTFLWCVPSRSVTARK